MSSLAHFAVLVVYWGIASNFAVTAVVSSGVSKTDSIIDTHHKLLKAQIEIIDINSGSGIENSLDDIKSRLSAVESEFKKLNELSDLRGAQANGSCDAVIAMQMIMNHYSTIDSQLKTLQLAVSERAQADDKNNVQKDIIEAVKSGNFKLADEKLIKAGDYAQISNVVHEVYANSEKNFGTLVKFARILSKISPSYEALKALHDEMRVNEHQDPNNLIVLAEAFESEVVKQKNDPNEIKAEASDIIDGLVATIKTTATEFLVKAMKSDCYQKNGDIQTLAGALYVFRPELSDEVMQLVVDGTYGEIDSDTILDNFLSHTITAQAISGVNALFWRFESDGKLNSSVILNLASDLSKLQKRSDFATLSQERKDAVQKVVENIPTCARNLFFKPSVCLWNKARDTYLLAANLTLKHDRDRRNIFTYSPPLNASLEEDTPTGASWFAEKIGDKILFRSATYIKEYLYVAAIDYNSEMRYVFNWIEGNNTDDQSAFNIELSGDHCYLKSAYFNEYMFASEVKYKDDDSYSYVFTWKPGTSGGNSDFVWQIRGC